MQDSIKKNSHPLILTRLFISTIFFSGIILSSDYFNYAGSDSIKYFIPYTLTLIVTAFLIHASLSYKIKNYFLILCATLPILVWGGSVVIPIISETYWPLTSILLLIFCTFRSFNTSEGSKLNKSEIIFWLLLFAFFGGRGVIYIIESSLSSKFDSHQFINWCMAPLLFCILVFSLRKRWGQDETANIITLGLKLLFFTTIIVAAVEIVTRGQNFGLNFLLHGANGGYSNSEGDVTGGHGEPLVLGMSAAFGAIIAAHTRNYRLLFAMTLIAVFCMSLRPMLIVGLISTTVILSTPKRKNAIGSIIIAIIAVCLGYLYKDVLLAKFLGVNSTSATLDYGYGVSVGYNIVYYFKGLQWAELAGFEISPWMQVATSSLFGGNEGALLLKSGLFALPLYLGIFKILLSAFIIIQALKRKLYKTASALTLFFFIVCHLDPFQALYRDNLNDIRLGSTPRESPAYFFIIYIVAAFYTLKKQETGTNFSTKNIIAILANK